MESFVENLRSVISEVNVGADLFCKCACSKECKTTGTESALKRIYLNVYSSYIRFRKLHNKSKKTSLPLYKKEIDKKIDENLAFALSDLEKILGEKTVEELIKEKKNEK